MSKNTDRNTKPLTTDLINRFLDRKSRCKIAEATGFKYETVRAAIERVDMDHPAVEHAIAEALKNAAKIADKMERVHKMTCTKNEAHFQ